MVYDIENEDHFSEKLKTTNYNRCLVCGTVMIDYGSKGLCCPMCGCDTKGYGHEKCPICGNLSGTKPCIWCLGDGKTAETLKQTFPWQGDPTRTKARTYILETSMQKMLISIMKARALKKIDA